MISPSVWDLMAIKSLWSLNMSAISLCGCVNHYKLPRTLEEYRIILLTGGMKFERPTGETLWKQHVHNTCGMWIVNQMHNNSYINVSLFCRKIVTLLNKEEKCYMVFIFHLRSEFLYGLGGRFIFPVVVKTDSGNISNLELILCHFGLTGNNFLNPFKLSCWA